MLVLDNGVFHLTSNGRELVNDQSIEVVEER